MRSACAVGGLPDFRTEIPEVRDHLIGANIALARRAGVAGLRLDTYKHVSKRRLGQHRRRTREALGRTSSCWPNTRAAMPSRWTASSSATR